jgi:uncharacterized protein YbjT (DUF2867 family)
MYLLTGATGYIGGRLLRRLERQAQPVRCVCRHPEVLLGRVASTTEVVHGDLLQPDSLPSTFAGVDVAFYLVHSMQAGEEFEERERESAVNFAHQASASPSLRRIIYLGGLSHDRELSPHMRSRAETGNILRSSGIPVIELRASIVIGSGSASFELIRSLVERLPVMVTPRWVKSAAQPIAIEDVLEYLVQAATLPEQGGLTIEIGGREVTSYLGIMREYARQQGLRRYFLPVPFLSTTLSSLWLTLVTPVYASIGRHLIESVRNSSVVHDSRGLDLFQVRPMSFRTAIARALCFEDGACAETRWFDAAGNSAWKESIEAGHPLLRNEQTAKLPLSCEEAFAPIRRIGGGTGWYFGNRLWRVRGLLDLLAGGVGMRRGRPDPETPLPGSALDFWRVQVYEPGRRLRLRAEMKVPGRAWLEFRAEPDTPFSTTIRQIAEFEPRGWWGRLYWYLLWPVHALLFRGMLRQIVAAASKRPMPVQHTAAPERTEI